MIWFRGRRRQRVLDGNPYLPRVATIEDILQETPDVKTFRMVFDDRETRDGFDFRAGQCAMISLPGVGESMISITSSPTWKGFLEFSVKKAGAVTGELHEAEPGQKAGIRGPLGNWFPVERIEGKRLVFVGGGIGLAPLRSLINYTLDNRDRFGRIDVIYGARSPQDLCFKRELSEVWPGKPDTFVHLTVDKGDAAWKGNEGFVPAFLEQVSPSPEGAIAFICGPPIMIKFVLQSLRKMSFTDDQIITTLEMKMKCGVGKCGRCNIGEKYVCVDGPVFSMAEIAGLPPEF
ncbi:MAG: FAD/NAD(P)-binding protein [Firmicutes bacterium]|nr:FAD/NAD(P)-binding protein [Bacillota bacterium]